MNDRVTRTCTHVHVHVHTVRCGMCSLSPYCVPYHQLGGVEQDPQHGQVQEETAVTSRH